MASEIHGARDSIAAGMARPSTPTLWRILLTAAFAAWVALATARGWSTRTVWKWTGVGLAVAGLVEWLWRGRSPRGQLAGTPGKSTQPTQPTHPSQPTHPAPPRPPDLPSVHLFPTGLLAPFSPLPPPRSLMPNLTSRIDLPGTPRSPFGRLVPFGDGREVIVRRGPAMGHDHGFERWRRLVRIGGHEFLVVTSMALHSPPVLAPGAQPMSAEAARSYQPISDVLYLPDAEVLIRREPDGFTDAEVERIVSAIALTPLAPPAATPGPAGAAVSLSPEHAMERLRARTATSYEFKAAISVVGRDGPSGAVPLLLAYLRNTDLTVVESACNALARLEAREAIPDLLDLLRPDAEKERHIDGSGDPSGWYETRPRASALAALTTLRVLEAEGGARALRGDLDPEVRRVAREYVTALGLRVDEGASPASS